ncbi:MAG: hypothetical protein GY943_05410, partial [Chloroflexi bacterium]|nr:hypothetical protein [Chloroflexota bacterium]
MFSSLKYDQFKLVAPLFVSLKHYVTLKSVFAGLTPGAVYVDDVDAPKTAVIAFNHRVYLAGDPTATKPETVNQ